MTVHAPQMGTDLQITPLHERFGVEVHDADLRRVTAERGYAEIRDAFETHSVLLFREQALDDAGLLAFAALFGPLEVRSQAARPPAPAVAPVTNVGENDEVAAEDDLLVQDLKANQLWHTDSTFLPVPALANTIAARVVPSRGGETELASTRAAWQDMPVDLKEKVRDVVLVHRFTHSRAKISAQLAAREVYAMWEDQSWRALWRNPCTGEDALYVAAHACAVEGMSQVQGLAFIDELIGWATREEYVYSHRWRAGDVIIWDERATLHRGRPWPYEEERTLASVCISAGAEDGLDSVSPD